MQETRVQSLGQKDPLEKEWLPTPVFLPGESHGQRSLVGQSPRDPKELDVAEWLTISFFFHWSDMILTTNIYLYSTLFLEELR